MIKAKRWKKDGNFSLILRKPAEMMRLGFLSLLLIVCEESVANICIPKRAGKNFLPCQDHEFDAEEAAKCADQVWFNKIENGFFFGILISF